MIREADEYVGHAMERLVEDLLFKPDGAADPAAIASARDQLMTELAVFEARAELPFLAGAPGAADFTLYPMIALALRMESRKKPSLGVRTALGPRLAAWMERVDALPYFAATYPPHWRNS